MLFITFIIIILLLFLIINLKISNTNTEKQLNNSHEHIISLQEYMREQELRIQQIIVDKNIIIETMKNDLPKQTAAAVERSRVTLKGKISEQIAPYMADFKHMPSDCRFIGSPIDLLVIDGMSNNNKELSIYIIDIKTGKSTLSTLQRKIRDAIKQGRVYFETYTLKEKIDE
jgi:predicted Holliday junction resolvase-like endonuclease